MSAYRRMSGARLSASAQARLDRLVSFLGLTSAARRLHERPSVVDRLAYGGSATAAVVARVEAALTEAT